ITAGVDRLCTVFDHLASAKQCGDFWMRFEFLKFGVWVDHRVFVIEAGHVSDAQDAVFHPVHPAAAVGIVVGWKSKSMNDFALREAAVRQLPQLFDAERKDHRLLSLVEAETRCYLFSQRAPRTFAEDCDLS